MDLPALDAFDASQPQAFYLGPDEEFAGLADAAVVAQGDCKLAVHTHVVSLHSRVLKSAFATGAGAGGAAEGKVCLKAPFEDFSPLTTAAFLRLLYHPDHACPANLKKLAAELPSLVRLADQLDCPGLMAKLDAFLADYADDLEMDEAVASVNFAEKMSLERLRAADIRRIASLLTAKPPEEEQDFFALPAELPAPVLLPVMAAPAAPPAPSPPADTAAKDEEDVLEAAAATSALKGLSPSALMAVLTLCVVAARRCDASKCIPKAGDLFAALPH
ncbi:DNA-binding [Chlorella sorokiniana]|uniref:DNA-binding n=1 Tax=Chlorella sorokiniana TaxID=3076 RepID=A0A2P6TT40_CHLSO|nr:DNA-binding [Chlorella sorokiniana]|eukprot:PRW57219.1 DNA-binding [Chlorella sorokiniana]